MITRNSADCKYFSFVESSVIVLMYVSGKENCEIWGEGFRRDPVNEAAFCMAY